MQLQLNDVLLADVSSAVPTIEISFAPAEDAAPEPYSPFSPLPNASFSPTTPTMDVDMDLYRPALLSPPARLSPLRPLSPRSQSGQGLDSDAFQNLLKASKERRASHAAKTSKGQQNLRKEVALKAHKSKQREFCFIIFH